MRRRSYVDVALVLFVWLTQLSVVVVSWTTARNLRRRNQKLSFTLLSRSSSSQRSLPVSMVSLLAAPRGGNNELDDSPPPPCNEQYHVLTNIERIFCLSDLHTDSTENMKWLEDTVAASDMNSNDLIIVAGDISHDLATFEQSLRILRTKCQVMFVVGNHEAWLDKTERTQFDSIQKLKYLEEKCRSYGCHVDPVYIEGKFPIWIVPLQSWYDGTLSFDETLCEGFHYWPWVDFARCHWPNQNFPLHDINSPNARIPKGLAEYYINSNERSLQMVKSDIINRRSEDGSPVKKMSNRLPCVVTVSHFLPNKQCLPDWKNLEANEFDTSSWLDHGAGSMSAKFAKVAGTNLLDRQIRNIFSRDDDDRFSSESMPRQIHVFGHSHRPKDFEYKGIRYIHNPLGKPRERQLYMVSPDVTFKLIWNTQVQGEVKSRTILRLWEEEGGGAGALIERMERKSSLGRYSQGSSDG